MRKSSWLQQASRRIFARSSPHGSRGQTWGVFPRPEKFTFWDMTPWQRGDHRAKKWLLTAFDHTTPANENSRPAGETSSTASTPKRGAKLIRNPHRRSDVSPALNFSSGSADLLVVICMSHWQSYCCRSASRSRATRPAQKSEPGNPLTIFLEASGVLIPVLNTRADSIWKGRAVEFSRPKLGPENGRRKCELAHFFHE